MPTVYDATVDSQGKAVSESILAVQGYHSGTGTFGSVQRSYLMFDLSSIPDNATVVSAVFGICVAGINSGTYYSSDPSTGVYYVGNDSWTESTITWANKPSYSIGGDYQDTVDNQYYEWDVLTGTDFQWNYMGDLLDNRISLMIKAELEGTNNWAQFYSSEAQGNQPYLKVGYTVPAVPEPTVMTLCLIGLGSAGVVFKKKKL
jgi:hypothetical protein